MPVAAHIDPDSRIVMFRCSGNVAISEARRAFDHMMTDPAVEPDTRALWDLRGAVIVEKPRAIPDILDMLRNRHPERVAGSRVAILVTEEHDEDVADIAQTHTENPTVKVFSSYADAARWLKGQNI
jgi:hypothetical protein